MPEHQLLPGGDPAQENWYRYIYCRDEGHMEFVKKAARCEDFVAGFQWHPQDLITLKAANRPAMVINKILSTLDHMVGEQIFNRSAIAFRPQRGEATTEVADALTKVGMNISQVNDLAYVRTDVCADGYVTSRGFYDVRINLGTNFLGDVEIKRQHPATVLLDPDASEYEPDEWEDVTISKWISETEMELLWGSKIKEELMSMPAGYIPYGNINDDFIREGRFGTAHRSSPSRSSGARGSWHPYGMVRYYRMIDRQHFRIVRSEVFVDTMLGDIIPVPEAWDHNRISEYLRLNPHIFVMRKPIKKVRWTVSAGNLTLHDNWSPYRHFTIVPFFPRLRDGRTIGVVEHLISPQEILNKSRSQELHILGTSANSGWVVQHNNLVNLTERQLETRGSETGLVVVVKNMDGIDKIKPNQVPTGFDRVSYKSEEDLKNISGISDALTGFAREDVSAKALKANQAVGSTSQAPLLDSLNRSDKMLGKRILDLVQTFYVEPRTLHIIATRPGQEHQAIEVNQIDSVGQIRNNLSLGEYGVVITNEPERDTYEANQYDQAIEMRRDLGIPIPDSFIIRVSKLRDKEELLQEMTDITPEEEQFNKELERRRAAAEVRKLEADAFDTEAEGTHTMVLAAKDRQALEGPDEGDLTPQQLAEAKLDMLKSQQNSNNKIREMNIQFMLDLRRMREEARLQIQVDKANPAPQGASQ